MKSLEELKSYYEQNLLPELRVLEAERIDARNKILLSCGAVLIIGGTLSAKQGHPGFLVFAAMICFFLTKMLSMKYVQDFKARIIEKVVKAVDEELAYSRADYIPEAVFKASKMFTHRIDRYHGDDYVKGRLGQTGVEFSEVHASYITRDSKGRTQNHPIFDGLFFSADFNKKFKSITVVLPDIAERMFGGLGTMLQSWNKSRGQLIKLEDPEFEKLFVVYGDDQIEARYILSTSLMSRIVEFKKKTKKNIHMSFSGDKIFVAISYARGLFEPRLFRTILDFAPIEQYYEDLKVATGIVEELNLNTRIWG